MTEPLSLSPDEMRRLGHAVIDRIVDHLEGLRELPPVRVGDPNELSAALGGPPPEQPGDPEEALAALFDDVLPWAQLGDHPRFFARVGSPSNYVSVLADAAAAGFNAFTGSWTGGSGASMVELVVLDWLRELCGMPEGSEGVLLTGGSVGSLTGLAAARTARFGARAPENAVTYLSAEAHASLPRALGVLGFVPAQLRVLDVLDGAGVRAAAAADVAAGRIPFCVVATAGSTSTGAVDPLPELSAVCRERGMWLHVDGAYGAPAVLCEAGHAALPGLGLADSLVLDPHKWLFQPYESGCLLVREPGLLERTFSLDGPYLRDALRGEVQLRNRSVELTRGGRGLKLWLSIRVFGLDAFRRAVAHGIALAEHAETVLRSRPAWEVVTGASLGIVTFRRVDGGDDLQTAIAEAMLREGFAVPSTTIVAGRVVLRLCTINPRTTAGDVEATIDRMEACQIRAADPDPPR